MILKQILNQVGEQTANIQNINKIHYIKITYETKIQHSSFKQQLRFLSAPNIIYINITLCFYVKIIV
jgi:hypothetical protein